MAEFTLANLENRNENELKEIEANDWRELIKQKTYLEKGVGSI
jgi:hypothetical protein